MSNVKHHEYDQHLNTAAHMYPVQLSTVYLFIFLLFLLLLVFSSITPLHLGKRIPLCESCIYQLWVSTNLY